ncbi:MAG: DeoR/GlpR transcriptional regulator [Betaproteobacteria bacterium]|nr:DeoR/GlpR transcriptional regulator [Betaproteobacteria bacterium]
MPSIRRDLDDLRSTPRRQARLLECVRSRLFVDAQSLKDELGVSIATIRRDLTELESRKLLRRTHGGAVNITQVTHDNDATSPRDANLEEKRRIAAAAAAMVADGDAVMIDSGNNIAASSLSAGGQSDFDFVTNGNDVPATLIAGGARAIHFIGGEYVPINQLVCGAMAAATDPFI